MTKGFQIDDTASELVCENKEEAKRKLAEEERLIKLYKQIDEFFDDMVGRILTLLESWGTIDEHQDGAAKLADAKRRLIKQTAREIQSRIKDLDF